MLNTYAKRSPEIRPALALPKEPFAILFVCTANICRSPTAESVMRRKIEEAGLRNRIIVDSAGTHDYHIGAPPDSQAQAAAKRRGYDLAPLRARQVRPDDFEMFDLVLAMDMDNLVMLRSRCPQSCLPKIRLVMDYADRRSPPVVPDPYQRSDRHFDKALDYIEEACGGLMDLLMYGQMMRR